MSRRLPVYILIDTSGSMKGEPIEAVKVGLSDMIATLRQDPYALETIWISVITYNKEVSQIVPLTALEDLYLPEIIVPDSGPTFTGLALKTLCEKYDREIHLSTPTQKGDWMPLLFLLTDGKPSDIQLYNSEIGKVKKRHFGNIIACAAGPKAQKEPLQRLTNEVFSLDTMDSCTFRKFFQWVSDTIGLGGKSVGATDSTELPEPPKEVNVVI